MTQKKAGRALPGDRGDGANMAGDRDDGVAVAIIAMRESDRPDGPRFDPCEHDRRASRRRPMCSDAPRSSNEAVVARAGEAAEREESWAA